MIKPINVVVPKFKCNLLKLGIHEVPDDVLPVMEIQETLEGEGINIGVPRLFIRVSGCAVGCTTCDTKDSWAVGEHPLAEVSSLADRLVKIVKGKVVEVSITGGEPLHYRPQVTRLSTLLRRAVLSLTAKPLTVLIRCRWISRRQIQVSNWGPTCWQPFTKLSRRCPRYMPRQWYETKKTWIGYYNISVGCYKTTLLCHTQSSLRPVLTTPRALFLLRNSNASPR